MFEWAKPILRSRSASEIYLLFVAIVLPWQEHQIMRKGITTFHLINSVLVLGILVSFLIRGPKPRWPFIVPMYVYLTGSFLGMFSSEALLINVYTLVQDFYLYLWFIVLCVLLDRRERIAALTLMWSLLVVVILGKEGFLPGVTGGERLEFSFKNPNRAAAYLTLSFFMLYHSAVPWILKIALGLMIVPAVSTTGSAAGYIGLCLGIAASVWAYLYMATPNRLRFLQPLGILAAVLMVLGSSLFAGREVTGIVEQLAPSAEGRVERSAGTRQEIWGKGIEVFREHPLGIGPASFHKQVALDLTESGSIELHSDFVAALVERGLIGLIGFLLLLVFVLVTLFRLLHRTALYGDHNQKLWAAGLFGAFAAYCFYSITHEALHHETYWLMLALIVSQLGIINRAAAATQVPVVKDWDFVTPDRVRGRA